LIATSRGPKRRGGDCSSELAGFRRVAVDLNASHLDCMVLDSSGNPVGHPVTIPLDLEDQCSTTRDGQLRAAISQLIALAKAHGCRAIAIEDLEFADARAQGRETFGRGRRGRRFRRVVAGIPTGRFRDRLTQMCANQGLWVVAVDPAYTSQWGREHWLAPMQETGTTTVTVHQAAGWCRTTLAWVSGSAAARCGPHSPADGCWGELPARPVTIPGQRRIRPARAASRQPHLGHGTGSGNRSRVRVQVAEDRSRPPVSHWEWLTRQERSSLPPWRAPGRTLQ
jgi:hypothetical protein